MDFLMIIMASGFARGRVYTTTTTTAKESRHVAAILLSKRSICRPVHVLYHRLKFKTHQRVASHFIHIISQNCLD